MKKVILLFAIVAALCSFTAIPFQVNEDSVILRLKNPDASPVDISVVDGEGRVVFEETLTLKEVGKVFNFKNAEPSNYTIYIHDGDTTYTQYFKVD